MKARGTSLFIFLFFIIFAVLILPRPVAAEDRADLAGSDGDKIKKYGITFPIGALENCSSLSECKIYCDDPVNHGTCISYAKEKGFYKEDKGRSETVLNRAKLELGCVSADSCKSFCSLETNYGKCASFAKKHNPSEDKVAKLSDNKTLEKAEGILGCSSVSKCKLFCDKSENYGKCSDFAKQIRIRGGEHRVGPGGCESEQSCTKFCSDPSNFTECSKYGKEGISSKTRTTPTGSATIFKGPGGCASELECKEYCIRNPSECYNFKAQLQNTYTESVDGKIYPTKTYIYPTGTTMTKEEYCRMYPEKCAYLTPSPTMYPKEGSSSYTNTQLSPTYYHYPSPTYYLSPTKYFQSTTNYDYDKAIYGASTENLIIRIINFLFLGF